MPLVVLEAARVGCPSLMFNITVHRELASRGLGAVFDHHRFHDLRQRTSQVLTQSREQVSHAWLKQFSIRPGSERYLAIVSKTPEA